MTAQSDLRTARPRPGAWPSLTAEDRFARVVEASPIALVLAGRDGRIEMVNAEAERMFRYLRQDLLGEPVERLFPPRFRHQPPALPDAFFTKALPGMLLERQSMFGLRSNNDEFAVEIALNPIEIDGEPMVLASLIDVTARHKQQREQDEQRRELARSNAELEEFAYAASHDLKAPLRAISHLVQWIGEDISASASPETLENLKLLQGRVVRMQMLLDGLLAYSRVDHTSSVVDTVDTAEIVHDIADLLAPPPGFSVVCEGTMPVIRTHRAAIQLVLENLIGNALKHHDRTEGRVTVSGKILDGTAEFRVSDDGPGIPTEFHERIFVMFQTLASRDDVEASGIGLTIKKKVQAHGGDIRVESTPPKRGFLEAIGMLEHYWRIIEFPV